MPARKWLSPAQQPNVKGNNPYIRGLVLFIVVLKHAFG